MRSGAPKTQVPLPVIPPPAPEGVFESDSSTEAPEEEAPPECCPAEPEPSEATHHPATHVQPTLSSSQMHCGENVGDEHAAEKESVGDALLQLDVPLNNMQHVVAASSVNDFIFAIVEENDAIVAQLRLEKKPEQVEEVEEEEEPMFEYGIGSDDEEVSFLYESPRRARPLEHVTMVDLALVAAGREPPERRVCSMCLDHPANTAVVGCGHVTACAVCAFEYNNTSQVQRCPLCNKAALDELGNVRFQALM